MRNSSNSLLLTFISLVILVTLAIQAYWNYRNFEAGKRQLVNEVQMSLDNALNLYYRELALRQAEALEMGKDSTTSGMDILLNEVPVSEEKQGRQMRIIHTDTFFTTDTGSQDLASLLQLAIDSAAAMQKREMKDLLEKAAQDSLKRLFDLSSRVLVSITTDTLETAKLKLYLREELDRKHIEGPFGYIFSNGSGKEQVYNKELLNDSGLSTLASSAYLPKGSSFRIYVGNTASTLLKRNVTGLLISAILIAAVILCLFFLLRIINRQKQLAALKDDLISNMTHEFKTPIATARVAIEGMESFNRENDPAKARKYLQVSKEQLDRLQLMVEKLLETASLEGEQLQLNREKLSLLRMLSNLTGQYRSMSPDKSFEFSADREEIFLWADPFHLESAIGNILDNGVKYGGNLIEMAVSSKAGTVEIRISDNGKGLRREEAEQVFEKFYRVPRGNLHDVKGYGIGLYYSRKIIEKHGGELSLFFNGKTNFLIKLPTNA